MNKIPVTPTYHQLHEATLKFGIMLNEFICSEKTRVVGISRGGLFMANLLSHQLNLPVSIIECKSKNYSNNIPFFSERNLIIVDDLCNSGRTMKYLYDRYSEFIDYYDIRTVVYYTKKNSVYIPTISWYNTPVDFPWIVFPWEDTIVV
jgi:hypoxanthine phosphoribosyltransferase